MKLMAIKKWKVLSRKKVFGSRFANVYEDRVRLPRGREIRDYTLVEKPSYVIIVATDYKGRVITIREYKHGAGEVQFALPAGFKERNESPLHAARRELEEETGYAGGAFRHLGTINEYASKDLHKVYVIRATGLKERAAQRLDPNEEVEVRLLSLPKLKGEIQAGKWRNASALSALAFSGLLH